MCIYRLSSVVCSPCPPLRSKNSSNLQIYQFFHGFFQQNSSKIVFQQNVPISYKSIFFGIFKRCKIGITCAMKADWSINTFSSVFFYLLFSFYGSSKRFEESRNKNLFMMSLIPSNKTISIWMSRS